MNSIKGLSLVLGLQLGMVSGSSMAASEAAAVASPLAASPTAQPIVAWKQCVIDAFAAMDAQDYDRFRQLVPDNAVFRFAGFSGTVGRDALIPLLQQYWTAFPDTRNEIVETVAEGEVVVAHVLCHGTQRGAYEGLAPTGRSVRYDQVHIVHFEHGRPREWWVLDDNLGLMRQLGRDLAPVAAAAPPETSSATSGADTTLANPPRSLP